MRKGRVLLDDRIKKFQEKFPNKHKDVAHFAGHFLKAIEQLNNDRYKEVGLNVVAGISPNAHEEKGFHDAVFQIKNLLFLNLEQTLEDIKHQHDRQWVKNFSDGIEWN
jgi:hypothetical protein